MARTPASWPVPRRSTARPCACRAGKRVWRYFRGLEALIRSLGVVLGSGAMWGRRAREAREERRPVPGRGCSAQQRRGASRCPPRPRPKSLRRVLQTRLRTLSEQGAAFHNPHLDARLHHAQHAGADARPAAQPLRCGRRRECIRPWRCRIGHGSQGPFAAQLALRCCCRVLWW